MTELGLGAGLFRGLFRMGDFAVFFCETEHKIGARQPAADNAHLTRAHGAWGSGERSTTSSAHGCCLMCSRSVYRVEFITACRVFGFWKEWCPKHDVVSSRLMFDVLTVSLHRNSRFGTRLRVEFITACRFFDFGHQRKSSETQTVERPLKSISVCT